MGMFGNALSALGGFTGSSVGKLAQPLTEGIFGAPYQAQMYNPDSEAFKNAMAAQNAQQLQGGLTSAQGQGPTQFTQQQMSLAQALQNQAQGNTPSISQMQLQQASENAMAQQAGALASQRALNPALAARLAAQQGSTAQQNLAAQSGQLRLQEQQGAQGQLANVLSQGNVGVSQQQQLQNDMTKYYQQALLDQQERERQAKISEQAMKAGQYSNMNQINAQGDAAKKQAIGGLLSGAGQAMASGGGGK